MESTPVCGSCLHRQVCRYFYDEQILAVEQKYFPIQLGVISCPFYAHTAEPVVYRSPAAQPIEHSFRPNLNEKVGFTEPEKVMKSPETTILASCIVCAEKTDQLCEICGTPICLNCVTEDMATGKSVCPTCWDAGPAAVIKESGELVHGS